MPLPMAARTECDEIFNSARATGRNWPLVMKMNEASAAALSPARKNRLALPTIAEIHSMDNLRGRWGPI